MLCVLYQQHPISATGGYLPIFVFSHLIATSMQSLLGRLPGSQASLPRCVYASLSGYHHHNPVATDYAHLLQRHSIGQASEQLPSCDSTSPSSPLTPFFANKHKLLANSGEATKS